MARRPVKYRTTLRRRRQTASTVRIGGWDSPEVGGGTAAARIPRDALSPSVTRHKR
jgi:hypothetical protein